MNHSNQKRYLAPSYNRGAWRKSGIHLQVEGKYTRKQTADSFIIILAANCSVEQFGEQFEGHEYSSLFCGFSIENFPLLLLFRDRSRGPPFASDDSISCRAQTDPSTAIRGFLMTLVNNLPRESDVLSRLNGMLDGLRNEVHARSESTAAFET